MKIKNNTTLALVFAVAVLAVLQGCSNENPDRIVGASQELTIVDRDDNQQRMNASIEIYGRVATVNAGTREITLEGASTLINVLEGAEIVFKSSGSETAISLNDVLPGDSIEARGNMGTGDVLNTDRVRIRPDDDLPGNELEVGGRVDSIDPVNRVLFLVGDTRTFNIHANAEIVTKNGGSEMPIELSEFMPGDSVNVRGAAQQDGSILANRLRLRLGGDDFHTELEFTKTIASIDYAAGIIMVDSLPEAIHVDANTLIYIKTDLGGKDDGNHATSDDGGMNPEDTAKMRIMLTDLSAGDLIEVHANRIDAANLYAVAIELEDGAFEHQMEVEFKDILASIDPATGMVTFQSENWTGTVVDGAELLGLTGETLMLSDFAAGEIVEARGFKTGEASFDIVHMHKDNNL